ncbi:SDR family NAD(P)-dependent oxidoreductase [Streptomyces sp. NPDC097610]|uniref:SDR family NAD(P)-dependent oxidoreductase n=1 Tax=Streptomyces sp. NPDC097610 TaxID=3157227 RepID=UPI003333FC3A
MDLQLLDKRVVVTGGGSGIGLAIAEQFAEEGAVVGICGRTRSTLDTALKRLAGYGGTAVAHVVDIADATAIGPWLETAAHELGGLDIVIHNASGASGVGEEAWRRNIDIDVLGFSRLVEHATPHLARSSAASIVALSSTAAVEAFGNPAAPFGAMKAALIHQCAGLSKTLAAQGIRVNAVSPGPIFFEGGAWDEVRSTRPEYYEGVVAQIPRGQMGTAEEVAHVVAFIASPAAALLTGTNIVADGGLTKRIPI